MMPIAQQQARLFRCRPTAVAPLGRAPSSSTRNISIASKPAALQPAANSRQRHVVRNSLSNGGDYLEPKRDPKGLQPLSAANLSSGNGVFVLCLTCVIFYGLDHVLHLPIMKKLYLNHAHPQWWQFITHQFCHGNLQHLSGNLFQLLVFGKMVEETEGASGVWFVFLITGLGAAIATYLLTPAMQNGHATVSVGASGAIFGLFAVSVVGRLVHFSFKRLLEATILGQFVVRQVLDEIKNVAGSGQLLGTMKVGHLAHLGGALAGVLLVLLLYRMPGGNDTSGAKPKTA